MRRLDRLLIGLAVAAIALGVLIAGAPSPTTTAPHGAESLHESPAIPPDQVGGPYMPWPVSFPKMLPGMVLLDRDAPQLAVKPRQARAMLPHVRAMGDAWKRVRDVEIKMRMLLEFRQDLYMSRHKHEREVSTAVDAMRQDFPSAPAGENLNVYVALTMCRRKAGTPVPAALAKKAQAWLRAPLQPQQYVQRPGTEWLTVFDQGIGIYHLERETDPDYPLTREQAAMLVPLLEAARAPIRAVAQHERAVADAFTSDQIAYIQQHMAELYKVRTGEFSYPGKTVTQENAYHDIVFLKSIQFLEKRAGP